MRGVRPRPTPEARRDSPIGWPGSRPGSPRPARTALRRRGRGRRRGRSGRRRRRRPRPVRSPEATSRGSKASSTSAVSTSADEVGVSWAQAWEVGHPDARLGGDVPLPGDVVDDGGIGLEAGEEFVGDGVVGDLGVQQLLRHGEEGGVDLFGLELDGGVQNAIGQLGSSLGRCGSRSSLCRRCRRRGRRAWWACRRPGTARRGRQGRRPGPEARDRWPRSGPRSGGGGQGLGAVDPDQCQPVAGG